MGVFGSPNAGDADGGVRAGLKADIVKLNDLMGRGVSSVEDGARSTMPGGLEA